MTVFDMPPSGAWEHRGGWVVRALMAEFGLADFQAAGIVGNVGFESGGFTKLHEIGQPEGVGGYGWGQWTADRRRTFLAWCAAHNLDWRSDEANYGYLVAELHGAYAATIAALRRVGSVQSATFSVGQTYERPGGTTADYLPGFDGRLDYAKRALAGSQAADLPPESATNSAPAYTRIDCARDMQTALARGGFDPGVIDGDWGPLSRAAYVRFNEG